MPCYTNYPQSEELRFKQYQSLLMPNDKAIFAGTLLQRAAHLFGSSCALISQSESITFHELYKKAVALSIALQKRGVKSGDRICLLFENSIEFYVAYYGAWQTGAVIVPLNFFLHEKEVLHIVQDSQPVTILLSEQWYEKIKHYQEELPPLVVGSELEKLSLPTEEELSLFEIPYVDDHRLAALLYTSGTTGFPKGVMLSSRNIITNIIQAAARIEVTNNDKVLAILPLFHSFAQLTCVWGNFVVGGAAIVVPKIDRKLILEGLSKQPTMIMGVPALYGLFCLMKNASFDTVRYFISGGDALPDKIRMMFELIYRRRICNGFGLTETSPLISANLEDELLQLNTVGRPSIGLECSIRDDDGNEVSCQSRGALWVKGDNIMMGYYNDAENTNAAIQNDWLSTGDCAVFDDDGRLIITGRQKDLIIHKGFNIYPQEIENILMTFPNVMKVGVLGKNDPEVGQVPIAFIALKNPPGDIEQVLKKYCQQHLAVYKIPRQFIILADLPMTSLGKIDKKKLRKEFFGQNNQQ